MIRFILIYQPDIRFTLHCIFVNSDRAELHTRATQLTDVQNNAKVLGLRMVSTHISKSTCSTKNTASK